MSPGSQAALWIYRTYMATLRAGVGLLGTWEAVFLWDKGYAGRAVGSLLITCFFVGWSLAHQQKVEDTWDDIGRDEH